MGVKTKAFYIIISYMFGGEQDTYRTVVALVERWCPSKAYGHERKFQSELQEYLEENLNSNGGGWMGNGGNCVVSTERGTSRGDVVVDDVVGIELKRNFSNSQKKKLRGQLEDYADDYPYVIACACGIEDMDGWRELENKFIHSRQGLGLERTQFDFIHKRRENFGTESGGGSDGLFGGGDGGLLGEL